MHLPHRYRTLAGKLPGNDGHSVAYNQAEIGLELFDLQHDVGETTNVAEQYPVIVARLLADAEVARQKLGDRLTKRVGSEVRPAGVLEQSPLP